MIEPRKNYVLSTQASHSRQPFGVWLLLLLLILLTNNCINEHFMWKYYSCWISWALCVCFVWLRGLQCIKCRSFPCLAQEKVSILHREQHFMYVCVCVLCNTNYPLSSRLVASSILCSRYIWLNQNANWVSGRLIWFPKNPETETLLVTSDDGHSCSVFCV